MEHIAAWKIGFVIWGTKCSRLWQAGMVTMNCPEPCLSQHLFWSFWRCFPICSFCPLWQRFCGSGHYFGVTQKISASGSWNGRIICVLQAGSEAGSLPKREPWLNGRPTAISSASIAKRFFVYPRGKERYASPVRSVKHRSRRKPEVRLCLDTLRPIWQT